MKRNILLLILTLIATSCFSPSEKLRETKFKPEMQAVADKYKSELQPEIFATSPGWSRFDTIETHRVIVSIINAKKLPENYSELNDLAKEISKDVYNQLENKNDFSMIEVLFRNKKGVGIANFQMSRNFQFKFEELTE